MQFLLFEYNLNIKFPHKIYSAKIIMIIHAKLDKNHWKFNILEHFI